jgi:vitamin B12 transporter
MLLRKLYIIGFALLLTLFSTFVLAQESTQYAQNTTGTSSMGSLDTVVVTADRGEETLREVSQSMEVISGDEIRASGSVNMADYLKKYGLQVSQGRGPNYGDETIGMRGLSTGAHGNDVVTDILILIDGRRAGSDALSFQSANMIERVEIIRGPGAVQYGAAAMGGVINFITKRGKDDLNVRAEGSVGSSDNYKASISFSGQVNKFEFAEGFAYGKAGDVTDGSGKLWAYSGVDYKIYNVANFGYNINDNNHINLTAFHSKQKNLGGGIYSASTIGRYMQFQDKDMSSYDLSYEGSTENIPISWFGRFYFGETSYVLNRDPSKAVPTPRPGEWYEASSTKNDFKGAQVNFRYEPSIFSFVIGADYLNYKFTQEQAETTSSPETTGDSDIKNFGIFLIAKAFLLENRNLILSAGLRYDTYSIDVHNIKAAFDANPETINDSNRDFRNTLPSIGIIYNPTDFLKLRANYSQAYKIPTPRYLAGNYYMGSTLYYGDINIEPEEATTWDIGFDFSWTNTVDISISYFETLYKNYVTSYDVSEGDPAIPGSNYDFYPVDGNQYFNIPDAKIRGLELDSRFNIGRFFNLPFELTPYFNFTYLFEFESKEDKILPSIARSSAGFGLDFYSPDWDLRYSLDGSYYGEIPVASSYNNQTPSTRTSGVIVWDTSLTKSLYDFTDKDSIKLKLSVNNIFDKYYEVTNGAYMPGRTFYVSFIYERK